MKYILLLVACLTFSVCSAQTATYATDSSRIELGELLCVRDSLGNTKYILVAELQKTLQPSSKKQDDTLLKITIFTFLGLLGGVLLTR